MTWSEGSPTIGRIFSPRLEEVFGPAREPQGELTKHHEDVAGALQAVLEDAYLHVVNEAQRRTGIDEPLPRRRRRAQRRRERTHPHRDARSTGSTSSLRPATAASRSAPRTTSGTRSSAVPRGFVMDHAYTGPEYSDARVRQRAARCGSRVGAARRRRALPRPSRSASRRATSSAGSRGGWSSARARSATARSSPTRAGTT